MMFAKITTKQIAPAEPNTISKIAEKSFFSSLLGRVFMLIYVAEKMFGWKQSQMFCIIFEQKYSKFMKQMILF